MIHANNVKIFFEAAELDYQGSANLTVAEHFDILRESAKDLDRDHRITLERLGAAMRPNLYPLSKERVRQIIAKSHIRGKDHDIARLGAAVGALLSRDHLPPDYVDMRVQGKTELDAQQNDWASQIPKGIPDKPTGPRGQGS